MALGVVTSSLKESASEIIRLGEADFMVAQEGAADLSFSIVSEEDATALTEYPDVARAEGALMHVVHVGTNPFFILMGRDAAGLAASPPSTMEGRLLAPDAIDEVMLGSRAADQLDAEIGDTVTIDDNAFRVVGTYQTGSLWQDSGAYAPLATVQDMSAKSDVVTAVYITVEPGADAAAVADGIENDFQNLVTIANVGEFGKVDQGVEFMDAANLAISVLAVGIGAIGVMNTMIMSVMERTREIGILRAVGWSGRRILRMIIGESLLLCAVAAVLGAALGVLATRAILLIDMVRNLLEPQYTLDIFIRGLVVAVVVALLGAIYPALRAVRLTPMEALRYE